MNAIINDLLSRKKELGKIIYDSQRTIKIAENEIIQIDELIKSQCNHNWIIDHECLDEHTIYKCTICDLFK